MPTLECETRDGRSMARRWLQASLSVAEGCRAHKIRALIPAANGDLQDAERMRTGPAKPKQSRTRVLVHGTNQGP